ncbi:MAG: ferritin-like domain-containing protein [Myxococcales bacterium]|nr:ferritin-like domain-containing protein [Myxococcales bacterium]
MIELGTEGGLLRRFVDELERTTPRAVPAQPDLTAYRGQDREAARLAWASRIADEYRSVAVFSELLMLLADLEAPYATMCAVQRLIGDELRHTHLMARVVDWLGGREDLVIDLADVGLPPRDANESPAMRAVRIVGRELVVAEEESIAVLAAYRDATTEPAIRAVFQIVLADEVRHAAAGRAILAELACSPRTAPACVGLDETMAVDRAELRVGYRTLAIGGPGRMLGASIELADLETIWHRMADDVCASACTA